MWYFERFDHCKSLVTYQNNYTEAHRFDRLVRTWRERGGQKQRETQTERQRQRLDGEKTV